MIPDLSSPEHCSLKTHVREMRCCVTESVLPLQQNSHVGTSFLIAVPCLPSCEANSHGLMQLPTDSLLQNFKFKKNSGHL